LAVVKRVFDVDSNLLAQAKAACGAASDDDTIRLGLEALVRRAALEQVRALRGAEPAALGVPRRREPSESGE
jgi:hypothetical protein